MRRRSGRWRICRHWIQGWSVGFSGWFNTSNAKISVFDYLHPILVAICDVLNGFQNRMQAINNDLINSCKKTCYSICGRHDRFCYLSPIVPSEHPVSITSGLLEHYISFKDVLYTTWGLLCHLPFLFKMHHTFPYVQFFSILKHHVQRKIILTILCNNDVIAFYWHPDYVHHSLQDSENIYGELFQLVSQDLATLFKKTYQLQKVST